MNSRTAVAALMLGIAGYSQVGSAQSLVDKARADHAAEEIQAGRLSYSQSCGWVDWGHAIGEGPKDLVSAVLRQTPMPLSPEDEAAVAAYRRQKGLAASRYYPVVYYQQMKKGLPGLTVATGTRSVYLVRKGLQRPTREGVAWRIFKEVSTQFEKMQGSGVYGVIPSTAASSFGIGDLTGDKISFYRALRNYAPSDISRICGQYSPGRSQQQLDRQKGNPGGQARWKQLPRQFSVPRISRGIVLTVIQDKQFYGEYR